MITTEQSLHIKKALQRHLRSKVLGEHSVDCTVRGGQMDVVILMPRIASYYEVAMGVRDCVKKFFTYASVSELTHHSDTRTNVVLFCSGIKDFTTAKAA